MGKEFEKPAEAEVPATPEQVWEAIATGPGIDSWFLGRNRVEDGKVESDFPGIPATDIEVWDPPRRLLHSSRSAEDGRFIAYEYLVEGRDRSTTLVRLVTSGFIPGDDWQDEFEAMGTGGELFFGTLVQYLTHFAGQTATPVTVFGPMVDDPGRVWDRFSSAVGLEHDPRPGDRVRISGIGPEPIEGTVYLRNRDTVGIRSGDALYRFIAGFQGPFIATHHLFTEADPSAATATWERWLGQIDAERKT